MASRLNPIADLTQLPAADVKKRGWRGVMRAVNRDGAVLVTNHSEPEAVILQAEEYVQLLKRAGAMEAEAHAELDRLRQQFDERLAGLQAPDAPARLRATMRGPVRLGGKVKAGASY